MNSVQVIAQAVRAITQRAKDPNSEISKALSGTILDQVTTGVAPKLDKTTAAATYDRAVRSSTVASLGDSIACNGSNGMSIVTLTAPAAAGATTITVTQTESPAVMTSDFPNDTLLRIGNEYSRTTGAPVNNSGTWTLTLTTGLAGAQAAGTRVMSMPTIFNGAPAAVLGASILSNGRLKFAGTYGHGGYNVEQMKRLYLPLVLAAKPGYCYVMAGRNPGLNVNLPIQGAAAVVDLWDNLIAGGVMPIASTLPPVNGATAQAKKDDQLFNAIIVREAQKRGIPCTDFFALAVDPTTGEYKTGLNTDTVHPSEKGRWVQAQGIWDAVKDRIPVATVAKVSTQAYADLAVHPLPATTDNALMLTGGGASYGAGSTSVAPRGWACGPTDVQGIITRPAAPTGSGNAIKITRMDGSSSGTAEVWAQANQATLVPGHRYLFVADIRTNGVNAAYTATPTFNGVKVWVTHSSVSATQTFFMLDKMRQDTNGTIAAEFVCSAAQPSVAIVYFALAGTALTPQYDATLWNVDIIDITNMGDAASSPWPYQGAA